MTKRLVLEFDEVKFHKAVKEKALKDNLSMRQVMLHLLKLWLDDKIKIR